MPTDAQSLAPRGAQRRANSLEGAPTSVQRKANKLNHFRSILGAKFFDFSNHFSALCFCGFSEASDCILVAILLRLWEVIFDSFSNVWEKVAPHEGIVSSHQIAGRAPGTATKSISQIEENTV